MQGGDQLVGRHGRGGQRGQHRRGRSSRDQRGSGESATLFCSFKNKGRHDHKKLHVYHNYMNVIGDGFGQSICYLVQYMAHDHIYLMSA